MYIYFFYLCIIIVTSKIIPRKNIKYFPFTSKLYPNSAYEIMVNELDNLKMFNELNNTNSNVTIN